MKSCSKQTEGFFSLLDATTPNIMIEAGCLVIDSLRCSEKLFPNITTRSFCLSKRKSTVKIFSSKKVSIVVILQGFNKRVLLNHCLAQQGLSAWKVSVIFLLSSDQPGHSEDWYFIFLCYSPVIFWLGPFSNVFLVASWLITWDLSDRVRPFRNTEAFKRCPSNEEPFCWRSAALKSQFSSPRFNKRIYHFF